jgi:hypothetical protein
MTAWKRAELTGCDLSETDFYEAKLPKSRIRTAISAGSSSPEPILMGAAYLARFWTACAERQVFAR